MRGSGIDYYDGLLYLREELRSFVWPNTPDSLALSDHQAIRDHVEVWVSADNHGVIPSGALALSVYNTPRFKRIAVARYARRVAVGWVTHGIGGGE